MFAPDLEDDVIPDDPAPQASTAVDEIPETPKADPVQQLEPKVGAMAKLIASTKAVDDASYLVVCEQTKGIKLLIAEVDATFDPLVKNARAAVDEAEETLRNRKADLAAVREKRAKHRGPLEQAEATNKAEIARYADEQERKAKAAEAERQAEEKRRLAAAAEQRAKEVSTLADAGQPEQAAALAAKPLPQPAPVVQSKAQAIAAPKATGITTSKVAKATVTNMPALVIAVADKLRKPEMAGPPLDVLTYGKAKLNAWATAREKGPVAGANGIEITGATATVADMKEFVLFMADWFRDEKRNNREGGGDSARFLDFIEVAPAVLNKWTTAQGTALNWPGVSVEMVTEVSASRRG